VAGREQVHVPHREHGTEGPASIIATVNRNPAAVAAVYVRLLGSRSGTIGRAVALPTR